MEGDIVAAMLAYTYGISTHALTWRATQLLERQGITECISTHALTWRATCKRRAKLV